MTGNTKYKQKGFTHHHFKYFMFLYNKKRFGLFNKSGAGFTLIEMIIALGIFVIVIIAITGIYTYASKGLRATAEGQEAVSDIRFTLETIAQSARTGQIDYDSYSGQTISNPEKDLFLISSNGIDKIAYRWDDTNKLITYQLNSDPAVILTDPANIEVEDLQFIITPLRDPYTLQDDLSYLEYQQPLVTIVQKVRSVSPREEEEKEINLQTTVSSRIYKR